MENTNGTVRYWGLRVGFVSLYLALAPVTAHSQISLPTAPALHSSDADLRPPALKDWPSVGGDWGSTRYSQLASVNRDSVKSLGSAWVSTFAEGGISRTPPVVRDGLMFTTAGRRVYAIDLRTGKVRWTYKTVQEPNAGAGQVHLDSSKQAAIPNALPNTKGVGVGLGLVFVGLRDGNVIALKEMTGKFVWMRQTGEEFTRKTQLVATAPTYVKGEVLTGLANGDANLRGRVTALDAATGNELWHIFVVPDPGKLGHETWPVDNQSWRFGGGGVWTTLAVDPDLGYVYFGTGSAAPSVSGDVRPGKNLFTCSVVAVELRTGVVKWYYQLVHHDVFEGDIGTPVILFDTSSDATARKLLAVLRADGYLFEFDRVTGAPVLPVEERAVPQLSSQKSYPTQPFPTEGESILMSCDDWKRQTLPSGFVLGCMWTPPASPPPSSDAPNVLAPYPSVRGQPMAYSPQTGYFYAHGISMLHWPRRSQDPYFVNLYLSVPGLHSYGETVAIDRRTGKIAWKRPGAVSFTSGGPLATAGGLIFHSLDDGQIEALDSTNGDIVWRFQTGMGGGGSPPVTYEVDGEQYVAVSMGSALWAFKLGGSASSARAPMTPSLDEQLAGPLVDDNHIDTLFLDQMEGRYFLDEYTFSPPRIRVKVGAKVLFSNNGTLEHEIIGENGKWTTGLLLPAQEAWVTFDTPGRYPYSCKGHPWSHGEIVVIPDSPSGSSHLTEQRGSASRRFDSFAKQALRGEIQYKKNCGSCHGENLQGGSTAPALFGSKFKLHWETATKDALFAKIRTTMPQTRPGGLDQQTYLDIVAFLLQANDMAPKAKRMADTNGVLNNTSGRTAK